MICAFPVRVSPKTERPCGKCHPCRENRRRKWQARLEMEAKGHPGKVSFHTLTYSDENLPVAQDPETGEELGTLRKDDLQGFLRRIARWDVNTRSFSNTTVNPVRYYACAEYGTKSARPHYHVVLYGLEPLLAETMTREVWTHGFTSTRPADRINMRYTLKYVLKNQSDPESPWLRGRLPTFALMSQRPPLGTALVPLVAKMLKRMACDDEGNPMEDFPREVRIDGEKFPLDRTMISFLKRELGFQPHQEAVAFPRMIMRPRNGEEDEKAKGHHQHSAIKAKRTTRFAV